MHRASFLLLASLGWLAPVRGGAESTAPQTTPRFEPAELLYQDDFADTARWLVEQRPGGLVSGSDGVLVIDDAGDAADFTGDPVDLLRQLLQARGRLAVDLHALVGGAALKADEFAGIIHAAAAKR